MICLYRQRRHQITASCVILCVILGTVLLKLFNLTLIPVCTRSYMPSKGWNEYSYPFWNFNCAIFSSNCSECGLTHWGRVTHICVSRLTITSSDIGLSPGWRQAIIRTNARILLIGPWGTNFSDNLIEILTFSLTKMRFKVSSAKWRPFCLSLNVLNLRSVYWYGLKATHVSDKYIKLSKQRCNE